MITTAPQLTDAGKSMLMRCIGGETITFTRFKIGNGSGEPSLTDIVNPLLEFGIASINTDNSGYVELNGRFASEDITSDFRWTELGLFARIGDEAEQLYAYVCDMENASMLKTGSSDVMIEQSVSVVVAVGTAQNVTALVSASALYVSKQNFDEHLQAFNPHKLRACDIGLGNVPNVKTNDQTPTYNLPTSMATQSLISGEALSTAFGKIARAILNLIGHLADKENPHGVSANQVGAALKEHTHGAADITSGILGVKRGGTGVESIEQLRSVIGSGIVTGVYYGTGTTKAHVELGFKPAAVLVTNCHGVCGVHNSGVCGGLCLPEHNVRSTVCTESTHENEWSDEHTALMIDSTGFYVNYNGVYGIATNISGETYHYIAWR